MVNDAEAIYSLIAPRPMLMLSGDEDGEAPTSGIIILEDILGKIYGIYGARRTSEVSSIQIPVMSTCLK